jgi:hypothetical protein
VAVGKGRSLWAAFLFERELYKVVVVSGVGEYYAYKRS